MNQDLKWIIISVACILLFFVLLCQFTIIQERRQWCKESGFFGQEEKPALLQVAKDSVVARVSCESILAETITKKDKNISILQNQIDWQNYCIIAKAFAKEHNKTFRVVIE